MSTAPREGASQQPGGGYPWLKSYPQGIDWAMRFEAAPVHTLLDKAAARFPERPCTSFLGKSMTYREIAQAVDRAAAGLQRLGVKKGTKVGLLLANCPTFIIFYYAILKAGGTVVNFSPLYTHEELTFQVKDSDTEIMVTLDLKLLFDKVEKLLADGHAAARGGCLVPRSAAGYQVGAVRAVQVGRPQPSRSLGHGVQDHLECRRCWLPMPSPRRSPSTRSRTSPSCNIRAARPAGRKARC